MTCSHPCKPERSATLHPPAMTISAPPTRPSTTTKPHIVTRVFDASRVLVCKVRTEPDHLAQGFAPEGRTGVVKSMDFRVGGVLHYGNEDGNGTIWGKATYTEISPKDRIAFLQSFSDEQGGIASHPMAP